MSSDRLLGTPIKSAVISIAARRSSPNAIARAHSATHLTHQALRDALGPTAAQAGSENSPGRFRFDFGSPAAVPGTVLTDVILLVSVDPVEETAVMISVPRDTGFVPLPDASIYADGLYPDKVNGLMTEEPVTLSV